jgi:hypothetical protein
MSDLQPISMDGEVSIAPVGSDDWQPIGHLTEPMTQTLGFTMENVNQDVLALLYGQNVGRTIPEPTHSVWMTYYEEVSGEPKKPRHVPGFWAWLRGTNEKNHKKYLTEYFRWVGAGKPTQTVATGIYIPAARINPA